MSPVRRQPLAEKEKRLLKIRHAKLERSSRNAELSQDVEVTVAAAAFGAGVLVYLGYRRWCACRPWAEPCNCHIIHTTPIHL